MGAGFFMYLLGRFPAQTEVWSKRIISLNGFFNQYTEIFERSSPVDQELLLQDAVYPFSQCILIAIVTIGHRWLNMMFPQHALVQRRAVLASSV